MVQKKKSKSKKKSKKKSTPFNKDNGNIRIEDLIVVDPLTDHQRDVKAAWVEDDQNLALYGTAGTGKTFLGMYFALESVMNKSTPYDQLIIIRSVVPTREIGYLPGSLDEKLNAYTGPYRAIAKQLFGGDSKAYDKLIDNKIVSFQSTSFVRGDTYDNSIILLDEMQNCTFHELDSIITRVGESTKIIFSGDVKQSDFKYDNDKKGLVKFLEIIKVMEAFTCIEFTWEDIVRSDLVRDYIMTKEWIEDQTVNK